MTYLIYLIYLTWPTCEAPWSSNPTPSSRHAPTRRQKPKPTTPQALSVTHVTFIWWGKRSSFNPGTIELQVRYCALQVPDKASKDDAPKYCAAAMREMRARGKKRGAFQRKALLGWGMLIRAHEGPKTPYISRNFQTIHRLDTTGSFRQNISSHHHQQRRR